MENFPLIALDWSGKYTWTCIADVAASCLKGSLVIQYLEIMSKIIVSTVYLFNKKDLSLRIDSIHFSLFPPFIFDFFFPIWYWTLYYVVLRITNFFFRIFLSAYCGSISLDYYILSLIHLIFFLCRFSPRFVQIS